MTPQALASEIQQEVRRSVEGSPGHEVLRGLRANEVFIGVVGPAGAGSGTAAKILKSFLGEYGFKVEIIKASLLIRRAAEAKGLSVPGIDERKSLAGVKMMQDRGDELRKGELYGWQEDHSAVARLVLREISKWRAKFQEQNFSAAEIEPDGKPHAYIIDSLRHPAEVYFLRRVYQDAFSMLGIVCDPKSREQRIRENFFDRSKWGEPETKNQVKEFLTRDEDAPSKHGQHVADTFHEADFFVDNSRDGDENLTLTGMNDQLRRFVDLITQRKIVRPLISETAMHQARSAQMRSACLSRQVGAALVDSLGNLVAIGTNDVPRAGGGLYGESFSVEVGGDERCAFRNEVFCSSNREQNKIIDEFIAEFPEIAGSTEKSLILKKLRSTRLGGLIEFSRAVHAEMDAILSASISGVSPRGCRMFVTTYPCHYCARHIVAAGIDEVQFIEPYPKSKATELHDDSIATDAEAWSPPSGGGTRVLFRPFVGVAPRLYRRVFLKDRDYKDKVTGAFALAEHPWGRLSEVYKVSYPTLEAKLSLGGADD